MTQPLSYEIITPGGYVMDRSHTKYAVNNGQLSSMNVLQVVCQKPHGTKPMASPINNSFTGREFSDRKLTNRWDLKALLLPLLPSSPMLRKKNLPILLLSRSVLSRQRSDPILSDQM